MNNSFEKLPEEYENDGNTYCHGIVNCKYYHDECVFMFMGSGNPDDMPCRVQEQSVISEFRKWKEEKEREEQTEVKGDLISREALKKHIAEIFEIEEKEDKKWAMGLKYSLKLIDNAPTVLHDNYSMGYQDGVRKVLSERPKGKWVKIFDNPFTNGYVCPFCGHKIQVTEQFLPEVTECEVCGAELKEDTPHA